MHSLQRAEDLRDGLFVAGEEPFDAVIAMALDGALLPALHGILPGLSRITAGATIIAVLGIVASARRCCARAPTRAFATRSRSSKCTSACTRYGAPRRRAAAACRGGQPAPAASGPQPVQNAPQLDAGTREIVEGAHRAELTRREYLLVECLMRQINLPVPRDQMIRYAWPEKDDIDASTVNLVVSRLRRRLAREGIDVRIDTINRYGYQLTLPTFD
ncbi:winged helix-turn-helix domain-containing protein [Paraburkholderia sp. CNPSo 3076]|uniref:winged helix-turn-helix domain-containing protein n=1 Tax=Paraburkholderia sp. CNPSo 3076 TaxID=2940936 RepID=UPI002254998D|nr:winged helix-turn-helix domain-containing protein [Paraburkholderia sp. CNPSo 3076]MCX5544710.1 winged helix-turn-helix domain-containing protein [Paraburkholderia sp. CNPSo 3076]